MGDSLTQRFSLIWQIMGDSLTLLEGEVDEEPYGLFPPLAGQGGLTPAAEMWNGVCACACV